MTSSLPDFSSSALNPPAADAASLATLSSASDNDTGSTPGFAALMNASSGPTAVTPASASEPPVATCTCTNSPTRMLSDPTPVAPAAGNPVESALTLFGMKALQAASGPDAAAPGAASTAPTGPAGRREITRDMLEEAASFVTSLLQAALPGVQLPQFSAVPGNGEPASTGTAGSPAGTTLSPSQAPAADVAQGLSTANDQPAAAAFTLAADGALELKLDLAQFHPAGFKLDLPSDQSVVVNAELQRPGEIVVRLEAAGSVPTVDASSPSGLSGRAIFAAKYPGLKISAGLSGQPGERNFVFTGDKQVKTQSPLAGISVAKTETTMPVAPIEESRFTLNPEPFSVLSQRAEFQVVVPPAERITVPADVPAGQNFAERAVDTVTSLVDTQFSASMQKSGSVQLHLRFGGEDLSVRVEIRDGAVHTDFHTDSPELRSALSREWQALAGQSPEQMRRYLEPVFSPAASSAPASTDTPSSFTRQQQQSQQDQSSRTPREFWVDPASPFSRRSQLSDSFIPEAAVTRGPSFLPTSMRLSVLA